MHTKRPLKKTDPGDLIKLANGTWEDFEIVFTGQGKKDNPIRLTAETPGGVFLSGQSNLRLAGEYLEVSGLVFKDGYTPTSEVIAFRNSKDVVNNSRMTEVVIDNFDNPERYETDFWVMMYGPINPILEETAAEFRRHAGFVNAHNCITEHHVS